MTALATTPSTAAWRVRAGLFALLIGAEWRHHPWRQAAAVVAVGLGVALAFAVHLINASALAEFETAVHAASGAPDFSVRGAQAAVPEALYPRVAQAPGVALASPVLEIDAALRGADGRPHEAQLLGLDALRAPAISPGWLPQPADAASAPDTDTGRALAALDPDRVFLNAAARALVGAATSVELQVDGRWRRLAVGGRVAAEGAPLVVIDIAGAQSHFDRLGLVSRIDVRLAPGGRREAVLAALGAGVRATTPDEQALRMARLSQSYRVNLGVLSLVALFTGAFLVFSVQSLAVAKRVPQLALLGVLGMAGAQRRRLVRVDSALVGLLGAALGLGLGTALASLALRALGGDLGSGALSTTTPHLAWSPLAAAAYGALGLASALAGGWWPARAAEAIVPAQSLKGLAAGQVAAWPAGVAVALLGAAAALAFAPPWHDIPWGAYACVAVGLLGGIGLVPPLVAGLLRGLRGARSPVVALAVARAIDQRQTATAAVAGVVASLSLVVALTVMVTSFRGSLVDWLGAVLPADLYVRPAGVAVGAGVMPPAVVDAAAHLPGAARARDERLVPLLLAPDRPEATLIARDLAPGAARPDLPWIDPPPATPPPAGAVAVYPTEVLAALQGLHVGDTLALPLPARAGGAPSAPASSAPVRAVVHGIWRDYARQQGGLLMARADWIRLTGDDRVSDLVVWLDRADPASRDVAAALRAAAPPDAPVDVLTSGDLRALSLRIFDRSFAVTRWLQAVALAIGLAGIAASFSAQVLARRREFGTLQHLGFQRRQVLAIVAAEGALWSAAGALLGLGLGLAVSVVLVKIVNPQSFHWSMSLSVPVPTLAALGLGVVAAGALTAWASGHAAAGRDVVRAVREDW